MHAIGRRVIPALLLLAAAAPSAAVAAEEGVPADGKDVVILADGRVISCAAGAEEGGKVPLTFTGGTVRVPKTEIVEIRRFVDFDPEPKDDAGRASRDAGMVRWNGQWITAAKRDDLLRKDRERAAKAWTETNFRLQWENRWKRDTRHFTIEANLPKETVDIYEQALEEYYSYFTSGFKVSVKKRIPVYIFRTREEFSEFQRKDTGTKSEHVVGYFMPRKGNEHLVLFDWQGNRAETLAVLFHECTHLLLHLANPEVDLPSMLNEGLSEYYGASMMVKGRMVRGRVQDDRLAHLRFLIDEGKQPPLDELLAHGHADRDAWGWKELTAEDYAGSWAFIHFLFHGAGGKYQPRLVAWLNGHLGLKFKDAAPGGSPSYYWMRYKEDRELLQRCLKVKDWATLEAEFREYVAGLSYDGPTGIISQGLGRLRRDGDEAAAGASFEEALRIAGDDPAVLIQLVKAFSRIEGKEQLATDLLDRVLALDPLNVAMRWEMSSWAPNPDSETPHLQMCQEMAPGDPLALAAAAWLAFRGMDRERWVSVSPFANQPAEEAREAIEGGGEVAPADCLRLARVLLAGGEPEAALTAARRAEKGLAGDPEALAVLARAAASCGESADFTRALAGLKAHWEKNAAAGPGPSPALRVSRALVEAGAQALASDRAAELRKVLDPWFATPGREPRLEAEWILHLATPVHLKDFPTLIKRCREAESGMSGSERLYLLLQIAAESAGGGGEEGE